MASETPRSSLGHPSMFGDQYCDLIVISNNYQWGGHRVIVCTASPYLAHHVNNSPRIDGKIVLVIPGGIDAPTTDRLMKFLYNKSIDDDDANLVLTPAPLALIRELIPSTDSHVLAKSANDVSVASPDVDLSEVDVNGLTHGFGRLDISGPFRTPQILTLWSRIRLHKAASLFDLRDLIDDCTSKLYNISRGAARAEGFAELLGRTIDFASPNLIEDGPCGVLAAECATNIVDLMRNEDFCTLLRQKDPFSFLILQSMVRAQDRSQTPNSTPEPLMLLPSPWQTTSRASSVTFTSIEQQRDEARIADLVKETSDLKDELAKADRMKECFINDMASKDSRIARMSCELTNSQQGLAEANAKVSQLQRPTQVAPVQRRGRGAFTAFDDEVAHAPGDPVPASLRDENSKLKGKVKDLTNQLKNNQHTGADTLEHERKKVSELQAHINAQAKLLNKDLAGNNAGNTDLMVKQKDLENKNSDLQRQLKEKAGAIAELKEQLAEKSDEISRLEDNDAQGEELINKLQQELVSSMSGVKTLSLKVTNLQSEVETKDARVSELSAQGQPCTMTADLIRVMSPIESPAPSPVLPVASQRRNGGPRTFAEKVQNLKSEREVAAGISRSPGHSASGSRPNGENSRPPHPAVLTPRTFTSNGVVIQSSVSGISSDDLKKAQEEIVDLKKKLMTQTVQAAQANQTAQQNQSRMQDVQTQSDRVKVELADTQQKLRDASSRVNNATDVRPGPHTTVARPGPHATLNGVRPSPNLSTNDIRNTPSPARNGMALSGNDVRNAPRVMSMGSSAALHGRPSGVARFDPHALTFTPSQDQVARLLQLAEVDPQIVSRTDMDTIMQSLSLPALPSIPSLQPTVLKTPPARLESSRHSRTPV
ncbi:hypothetical protein BDV97DRAFT_370091 [Delphinella strobiligena]|nr:hypothetical protein BDV97DRAFT_370091 [Delphinella strobiligena]